MLFLNPNVIEATYKVAETVPSLYLVSEACIAVMTTTPGLIIVTVLAFVPDKVATPLLVGILYVKDPLRSDVGGDIVKILLSCPYSFCEIPKFVNVVLALAIVKVISTLVAAL